MDNNQMKRRERLNNINIIKVRNIGVSICLCLCISAIPHTSISVSAKDIEYITYYETGHGSNTYSLEELLSEYKANSMVYKRNILNYKIQSLNGKIADENYSDIKSQYLDVL